MADVIDSDDLLALAGAFVSQGDRVNPCIADTVEVFDDHIVIHYSWARGSSEWTTTQLELMAWGWNNPKT